MTVADNETQGGLILLRIARDRCSRLEYELGQARAERDRLALAAIDTGQSWRRVASAAGFANPYIARLKRRAKAAAS